MNIRNTKKPDTRIDLRYLSSLGIKTYGENNLYPQQLRDIVFASPAGRTCVERRATYIEGNGIASQALSDMRCNVLGQTFDTVHSLCAADLAMYDGFAIHVNYDVLGSVVSVEHVPFENCRLEEEDNDGVVGHIVLHPDWTGRRTRGGKAVKVSKETIDAIPVFNPDPEVVQSQIFAAGGVEFYKGQVLYVSRSGGVNYPIPVYDSALTDMSTDEGLSNINYRNARNSFLPGGMIFAKTGQSRGITDGDDHSAEIEDGFFERIQELQTDMNLGKIGVWFGDSDQDKPEIIPFQTRNYDKEFTATTQSVIGNIYAAFNQEMFARLRSGSLGFSGDITNDVKREYCEQVTKQQRMLSRAYKSIFDCWSPGAMPYSSFEDVKIEPLVDTIQSADVQRIPADVLKDLTTNERRSLAGFGDLPDQNSEQQLLAERIGLGGTQSMIGIVSSTDMSDIQKKELIKLLFGLQDQDTDKLFTPQTNG